jgi:hypothetical protein
MEAEAVLAKHGMAVTSIPHEVQVVMATSGLTHEIRLQSEETRPKVHQRKIVDAVGMYTPSETEEHLVSNPSTDDGQAPKTDDPSSLGAQTPAQNNAARRYVSPDAGIDLLTLLSAPSDTPRPLRNIYEAVAAAVFDASNLQHDIALKGCSPLDFEPRAVGLATAWRSARDKLFCQEIWFVANAEDAFRCFVQVLREVERINHACGHFILADHSAEPPDPLFRDYYFGDGCQPCEIHQCPPFMGDVRSYFASLPSIDQRGLLMQMRHVTARASYNLSQHQNPLASTTGPENQKFGTHEAHEVPPPTDSRTAGSQGPPVHRTEGPPVPAKAMASVRMTVAEANGRAMQIARRMGDEFFLLSERKQAKQIGCSWTTWSRTDFYRGAKNKKVSLAKQIVKGHTPSSPPVVRLTDSLQAVTGEGNRDEVLNKLIAEQEADLEPSPLDQSSQKRIHSRKRL